MLSFVRLVSWLICYNVNFVEVECVRLNRASRAFHRMPNQRIRSSRPLDPATVIRESRVWTFPPPLSFVPAASIQVHNRLVRLFRSVPEEVCECLPVIGCVLIHSDAAWTFELRKNEDAAVVESRTLYVWALGRNKIINQMYEFDDDVNVVDVVFAKDIGHVAYRTAKQITITFGTAAPYYWLSFDREIANVSSSV